MAPLDDLNSAASYDGDALMDTFLLDTNDNPDSNLESLNKFGESELYEIMRSYVQLPPDYADPSTLLHLEEINSITRLLQEGNNAEAIRAIPNLIQTYMYDALTINELCFKYSQDRIDDSVAEKLEFHIRRYTHAFVTESFITRTNDTNISFSEAIEKLNQRINMKIHQKYFDNSTDEAQSEVPDDIQINLNTLQRRLYSDIFIICRQDRAEFYLDDKPLNIHQLSSLDKQELRRKIESGEARLFTRRQKLRSLFGEYYLLDRAQGLIYKTTPSYKEVVELIVSSRV